MSYYIFIVLGREGENKKKFHSSTVLIKNGTLMISSFNDLMKVQLLQLARLVFFEIFTKLRKFIFTMHLDN